MLALGGSSAADGITSAKTLREFGALAHPLAMLNAVGEGVWECSMPLKVAGFHLDHRMTVMRMPSGELVVHSPVELDERLRQEVSHQGEVKWIISPSRMHDLFLNQWMEAFPGALLLHSPGLKIRGIPAERLLPLSDESSRLFGGEIDCLLIRGMPRINEFVFLHRPSRTLIVADLVFNLSPAGGLQKVLQKVNGVYEQFGPSRLFRMSIKNKAEFRDSLKRVLEWDFDWIIVGHGANAPMDGKDRLRRAFEWLL